MCGFAGFFGGFHKYFIKDADHLLNKMGDTILHRGPDDTGNWYDDKIEIAMTHRRLAIQDLSNLGHQPMISSSGRYVLVYNGEIYNHLELREQLNEKYSKVKANVNWLGHSDTETLLHGIETWGLENTLIRSIGMFSLALWDKKEYKLSLARDRIGEKPLYYGWQNGVFLFGSELKSFKVHPAFKGDINRDSIALQLRHNYIPAPYSIYKDIKKLNPGSIYCITKSDVDKIQSGLIKQYWIFKNAANRSQIDLFNGSHSDAINILEILIKDSVNRQMLADVPLGAFLSGGIDSSIIVSIMQSLSARKVKTFTIGFNDNDHNEAIYARDVAKHIGTEHTELYINSNQALSIIPELHSIYDEPFSDSSQIPTYLVSKLTKQYVTVSLSGDGGDELFGGYRRYLKVSKWRNRVPNNLNMMRKIASYVPSLLGKIILSKADLFNHLEDLLISSNNAEFYLPRVSHWKRPNDLVIGSRKVPTIFIDEYTKYNNDFIHDLMGIDTLSYLPDDILVKVDRAAMAVSLETRVPLLDHKIIEFAWRLPLKYKIYNGEAKWPLKKILHKYVPKTMVDRPKKGFGVPLDKWLRGPLREWAEELLDESRIQQGGYLTPKPIRRKWKEHLSGNKNWQYHLWDVLMFQSWLDGTNK